MILPPKDERSVLIKRQILLGVTRDKCFYNRKEKRESQCGITQFIILTSQRTTSNDSHSHQNLQCIQNSQVNVKGISFKFVTPLDH